MIRLYYFIDIFVCIAIALAVAYIININYIAAMAFVMSITMVEIILEEVAENGCDLLQRFVTATATYPIIVSVVGLATIMVVETPPFGVAFVMVYFVARLIYIELIRLSQYLRDHDQQ